LHSIGAEYVVSTASKTYEQDLVAALSATGATIAFDATGGGSLGFEIIKAMETAAIGRGGNMTGYGSTTFKNRIAIVDKMDKEIEDYIDRLAAAGNEELANLLRNAVNAAKNLLGILLDLKMQMFVDVRLSDAARESEGALAAAFVQLRKKLLAQQRESSQRASNLANDIAGDVRKLSHEGQDLADKMASFLSNMVEKLSDGTEGQFANTLNYIGSIFTDAVHGGDLVRERIGKDLHDLAGKEDHLKEFIEELTGEVVKEGEDFDDYRKRVLASLADLNKLDKVSEDVIDQKVQKLQALLAHLKIQNNALERSLLEEGEGDSQVGTRLAELEKRMDEDAKYRTAVTADQERLKAEVRDAEMLLKEVHSDGTIS